MSDILPESLFTESTPRNRGLHFINTTLKYLAQDSYKVSNLAEGTLPSRAFPNELSDGLSSWIDTAEQNGQIVRILDLAAGEGKLENDLQDRQEAEVISADIYPPQTANDGRYVQLDANSPLPFTDRSFSMCILSFALPYLTDPIKTINEMIRVTKPNGFILLNGADKVYLEDHYFFSSMNPVTDEDIIVYNSGRFSDGDWVVLQVLNPDFRFNCELNTTRSFTVSNKGTSAMAVPVYQNYGISYEERDIRDLVKFVYHKHP